MKIILTLLFFTYCLNAISQDEKAISMLKEGMVEYKNRNYIKAQKKFKDSSRLFNELQNYDYETYSNLYLASAYLHNGESSKSFSIYNNAYKNFDLIHEDSLKVRLLFALSTMYEFRSRYDSVKILQNKALEFTDVDEDYISDSYTLLHRCYSAAGDYDSSVIMLQRALEIDWHDADSSSLVFNLLEYGESLSYKGRNDSAIYYSLKSLEYLRKGLDDFKKPSVYENISKIFSKIGNYQKALEYAQNGSSLAESMNLNFARERCLIYVGDNLKNLGRFDEALIQYSIADSLNIISNKLERRYKISRGIILCQIENNLPLDAEKIQNVHDFKNNTESHIESLECGLLLLEADIYKGISTLDFYKAYDKLENDSIIQSGVHWNKNLLSLKKRFEQKNELWEDLAFTSVKLDSVNFKIRQTENVKLVHDIEGKYKKQEQDLKIQGLKTESKLKDRVILISLLALSLITILSFFLYRLYRKISVQKKIISKSLDDKDILLREIHHRVKNNLQVVSSLLRLQSNSTKDELAQEALNEGQARVRSMALIHQNLYGKDNLTGITMKPYIDELCTELVHTYSTSRTIDLATEIDDVKLDVDSVVPLGLIINELVTNSIKHAFDNVLDPRIIVKLKDRDDNLELIVEDNGVGLDKESLESDSNSFGFNLINSFKLKLGAELEVKSELGTHVRMLIRNFDRIS